MPTMRGAPRRERFFHPGGYAIAHPGALVAQIIALARKAARHTHCSPGSLRSSSDTLVQEDAVLICRCAWHQRYCGYPLLNGVVSWRGWTLRFTDGICEKCLERFRAEHRSFLERRRVFEGRLAPAVTTNEAA